MKVLDQYRKLIQMSKEALDAALVPVRAQEMKMKGHVILSQLDGDLIKKESEIQGITTKYPLEFNSLLDLLDDAAIIERRRAQLKSVLDQLFPGEPA